MYLSPLGPEKLFSRYLLECSTACGTLDLKSPGFGLILGFTDRKPTDRTVKPLAKDLSLALPSINVFGFLASGRQIQVGVHGGAQRHPETHSPFPTEQPKGRLDHEQV